MAEESEPKEEGLEGSGESESEARRHAGKGLTDTGSDDLNSSAVPDLGEAPTPGNLLWEYSMYMTAGGLFCFAFLIWEFSLGTILSNSQVPTILDQPCFFGFLLLGLIFLALGFSVKELEMEESEEGDKGESCGDGVMVHNHCLPIHDDIPFKRLEFANGKERDVFQRLFDEQDEAESKEDRGDEAGNVEWASEHKGIEPGKEPKSRSVKFDEGSES